jgi:hypothetical protein
MTLTTALALAAVAALLALALHGWWRVRRARPKAAAGSSRFAASTLEERHEPTMDMPGGGPPTLEDAVTEPGALPDGVLSPAATARAALRRTPRLDALIDALVPLVLDAPTSAEQVLAHAPASRRAGSKPFYIEGLDTETGEWEPLTPGRRYGELQAGVQLANRGGPLNEIEYSEFVQKVEALAESLGARTDMPDMLEVVARARELDQFASSHDAQLSFTLRATRAAWSPGYVQQNAARLGFVPGVIPGRMVLPAPVVGQAPIVILSFDPQAAMAEDPDQSAVREINLSLDVPHVARTEEPFARLCHAARELAKAMDGTITDDNGQPLADAALRAIDTDLRTLYNTLDARDLSAGSAQARRLFS